MSTRNAVPVVCLFAAFLVGCSPSTEGPVAETPDADFVLTNGRVYTVDEAQPWAEAVAVKGTDIVYVGDHAGADAFVGETTEQIDLQGRLLLPGFVESHIHMLAGGAITSGLRLGVTDSRDDVLRKLGEYAAERPDRATIFGASYNSRMFTSEPRTKEMLDAVVSERPVILLDDTIHSAWVNSKALEVAGITKDTPDPSGGTYERDANGEATGAIRGAPAHVPVMLALNAVSAEAMAGAVPEITEAMNEFGAARLGYNTIIHACGDRGTRAIVVAGQALRSAGYDTILTGTHVEMVHPDDVSRFGALDIIAQTTPNWAVTYAALHESLGTERYHTRKQPFRGWIDGGAIVSLGADFPATPGGLEYGVNPFNNIYAAMHRKNPPEIRHEFGSDPDPLPPLDEV